jgi:hypothetical protein
MLIDEPRCAKPSVESDEAHFETPNTLNAEPKLL